MASCYAWILENLYFSLHLWPAISSLLTKFKTPNQTPRRPSYILCRGEPHARRIRCFLGYWWSRQGAAIGSANFSVNYVYVRIESCPDAVALGCFLSLHNDWRGSCLSAESFAVRNTLENSMFLISCTLMYSRMLHS